MRAIRVILTAEQYHELDQIYTTTKDVRIRSRAQMIFLSSEQGLVAHQIAAIVREDEDTVVRWLKRYQSHGVVGLKDLPRSGAPSRIGPDFLDELLRSVRQRPRSLGLSFSSWTCRRLADYLAAHTGIRVSHSTIQRQLAKAEIVLSRPQHKVCSPDPLYEVKKRRLKTNVPR
jgi:transposase